MRLRTLGAAATSAIFALGLTACSQETSGQEISGDTNAGAAAFVACLKSEGAAAKVSEDNDMVLVPASAMDTEFQMGPSDGDMVSLTSEQTDEHAPVSIEVGDDQVWFAPVNSDALTADPTLQDAYRKCEAKFPDFRQPELEPLAEMSQTEFETTMQNALKFAQCGRSNGFSWVADPDPEMMGIELPEGLRPEEFRALLDTCLVPEEPVGWITQENHEDLMDVLNEYYATELGD